MVPERTQARANPTRGVALIATAVVIGILLLRNWDGPALDGAAAEQTQGDGSTDTTGANGAGQPGTTPTTVAARPTTEVTVRVLNATDVSGAAKKTSDLLAEKNKYKTVDPDDAGVKVDTTQIVYAAGYEREAQELASAIGSPPDAIVALANPPQFDPKGAHLVVVLGKDLATSG